MGQRLLLVAPEAAMAELATLRRAWRRRGVEVIEQPYGGGVPPAAGLLDGHAALDAVLLAGSARRAPATVLPGPFLHDAWGRRVAAAWLPLRAAADTQRFSAAAAQVQQRPRQQLAVALLGQWHPNYLRVAQRIAARLDGQAHTLRWTGDVLMREDMLHALGTGLGLGLYVGHGRPSGWVGYHGVRRHHFPVPATGEPLGALLSLCCRTASRRRIGLSYAEALALRGVSAASLGAIGDTLHTDNTRWALGLCDALGAGARTVGELVAQAAPPGPAAWQPYRLIGDPLAPLDSARAAVAAALAVPTHP